MSIIFSTGMTWKGPHYRAKTQISVDDSLPWGPWARRIIEIDLSPPEHQLPPVGNILKEMLTLEYAS